MKHKYRRIIFAPLAGILLHVSAHAGEVKLAVAANFTAAMREIAKGFEQSTGHKTRISFGSTGKLYTQILYHAPFDVFLAADYARPRLLWQKQMSGKPFTYAMGKLVLWSRDHRREVNEKTLIQGKFNKVALANPKTAPYGVAALSVMERLGIGDALKSKRVYGDSIAQAYQFTASGNTDLGFVALAQILLQDKGSVWRIPQSLYEPIRQDAVLLNPSRDNPAATALMAYLQSAAAQAVIEKYGYSVK